MLRYNTQQKPLALPEYGRNIQSMVDHCLTIENRQERTTCAYTIIESMANLFPELKSGGEYDNKLWDHLVIMSDFKLDIDFPCDVITAENLHTHPEKVDYNTITVRRRQYGKILEQMIIKASDVEDEEERIELLSMIANQMKKALFAVNADGIEDAKIFKDIYEISEGKIRIEDGQLKLKDYIIPQQIVGKKKKKK